LRYYTPFAKKARCPGSLEARALASRGSPRMQLKVSRLLQHIDQHAYNQVMMLDPHLRSSLALEVDISRELLIIHGEYKPEHVEQLTSSKLRLRACYAVWRRWLRSRSEHPERKLLPRS